MKDLLNWAWSGSTAKFVTLLLFEGWEKGDWNSVDAESLQQNVRSEKTTLFLCNVDHYH